jgi:quercetin dioxygenase-like cupin family protein
MARQATGLHVNPSGETIRLGPLAVRFLLTGDNSSGSVAAFELVVPAAQHLAAPAYSHDHYEETIYGIAGVLTWTVDGTPVDVGPGQALCIPRGAIHRFDNKFRDLCRIVKKVDEARHGSRRRRTTWPGRDVRPGQSCYT